MQNLVVIALVDIQVGQELYGPSLLMSTAIRTDRICGRNLDFMRPMCVAADTHGGDADTIVNEADRLCTQLRTVGCVAGRASCRGD